MKSNFTYVCSTCSQCFTRKESGKRHNNNLHSGTAKIVRFIDYIIGRISGHYLPSDPLSYRNKNNNKKKHKIFSPNKYDNETGFTVLADNLGDTRYCENAIDGLTDYKNNNMDKQYIRRTPPVLDLKSKQPILNEAVEKSSSYSDEFKQARSKLIELQQLLIPFCYPQFIYNTLNTIVRCCNIRGDYIVIDEALENHRNNISKPGWYMDTK
jgi:hypothetical protein